jgi:hypothetical protein
MATRKKPAARKPAARKKPAPKHVAEDIFGKDNDDLKQSMVAGLLARRELLFSNLQQRIRAVQDAKNEVLMIRGMFQEVNEQLKNLGHVDPPPQEGQANAS